MNPNDYAFVGDLLKRRSGLVLAPGKDYLLESRLMPIARERGLTSLDSLVEELRRPGCEALQVAVTEAMTTNESFFFRDMTPFDHFREVMVPHMLETRAARRRFRIWCAACSTGQEPYSLSMILKEMADKLVGWNIEIVATDLSAEVLEKAKAGLYSQFEVQRGMPIQMLVKYFTQTGEMWTIDASIRAMVNFKPFNLLDNFAGLNTFDIVFCRNVLIYFDQPTKTDILNRVGGLLADDGYLVLGAAETIIGITDAFKQVPDRRALYTTVRNDFSARPAAARAAAGGVSSFPISKAI